jgi:hypothetical protein
MACVFQGSALPSVNTTTTAVQTAPAFYTNYLQQLAQCGASAAQNAQFVPATALQNQAFTNAAANVGSYQPALSGALTAAKGVAGQCVSKLAQNYMNPYTQNVVNAIGNLGQANIAQNLAPSANAGLVGSGQFGSSRGAAALGTVLANAGLGITAQQACALQKGYNTALCTAQKQIQDQLAASQQLGNIATQTGALNAQCLANLETAGNIQRCLLQQAQCFKMNELTKEANLLKGFSIPGTTATSYSGPLPGAYSNSPLSQIAGLGSLATGLTGLASGLGNALSGSSGSGSSGSSSSCCGYTQAQINSGALNPVDPSVAASYNAMFE